MDKHLLNLLMVGAILLALVISRPAKADPLLHFAGGAIATGTAYWLYHCPLHLDETNATIFSIVVGTSVNLLAEGLSREFSTSDWAAGQAGVIVAPVLIWSFK